MEVQATGEALLLDPLLSEYGLHRPTLTGGPFGIIMVSPQPHGILVRVAPRQLPRWRAAVLRTVPTGAPLLWSAEEHGIALTIAGARVVLVATTESNWRAAMNQTERSVDQPGSARAQDDRIGYLSPIVPELSATLRRVRLLTDSEVRSPTVELLIVEHHGERCLYDATGGAPLGGTTVAIAGCPARAVAVGSALPFTGRSPEPHTILTPRDRRPTRRRHLTPVLTNPARLRTNTHHSRVADGVLAPVVGVIGSR
ncbi:hypothetical protein [Streptomyces sp. NPDC048411]|uniref:hypothetical protein n=1 Tax=Streptomyces sp. NPDC048411 TaxID=3157206 RepID=UPI0034543E36